MHTINNQHLTWCLFCQTSTTKTPLKQDTISFFYLFQTKGNVGQRVKLHLRGENYLNILCIHGKEDDDILVGIKI